MIFPDAKAVSELTGRQEMLIDLYDMMKAIKNAILEYLKDTSQAQSS